MTPLETCIASLHESRAELTRLLDLAEQKARAAVAASNPAERKRLLDEACDAEFEALLDCDACGGLVTALGLDEDDPQIGEPSNENETTQSTQVEV